MNASRQVLYVSMTRIARVKSGGRCLRPGLLAAAHERFGMASESLLSMPGLTILRRRHQSWGFWVVRMVVKGVVYDSFYRTPFPCLQGRYVRGVSRAVFCAVPVRGVAVIHSLTVKRCFLYLRALFDLV